MSFIVVFQNITDLAPTSDYKVDVFVNERYIAGPFVVKGHKRNDGWQALVKQFARGLQTKEYTP